MVDDRILRVPLVRLAAAAPRRAVFPLKRQFESSASLALTRPPPDPAAELPRMRQRVTATVPPPTGLETAPPSPLAALATSVHSTSSTWVAIDLGRTAKAPPFTALLFKKRQLLQITPTARTTI